MTTAHPHHRPPYLWSACFPMKSRSRREVQRRRMTAMAQGRRQGQTPGLGEPEVEGWRSRWTPRGPCARSRALHRTERQRRGSWRRLAMAEEIHEPRGSANERRKQIVPEPRSRRGLERPIGEEGWRRCRRESWRGCRWAGRPRPSLPCVRRCPPTPSSGAGCRSPGHRGRDRKQERGLGPGQEPEPEPERERKRKRKKSRCRRIAASSDASASNDVEVPS